MEPKSFREDVAARVTIAVIGVVFLALGIAKAVIFDWYGTTAAYQIVSLFFYITLLLCLVCGVILSRRLKNGYYRREQRPNAGPTAKFLVEKPNTMAFLIAVGIGLIFALAYVAMPGVMHNARLAPLVLTFGAIGLGVVIFLALSYFHRQKRDDA